MWRPHAAQTSLVRRSYGSWVLARKDRSLLTKRDPAEPTRAESSRPIEQGSCRRARCGQGRVLAMLAEPARGSGRSLDLRCARRRALCVAMGRGMPPAGLQARDARSRSAMPVPRTGCGARQLVIAKWSPFGERKWVPFGEHRSAASFYGHASMLNEAAFGGRGDRRHRLARPADVRYAHLADHARAATPTRPSFHVGGRWALDDSHVATDPSGVSVPATVRGNTATAFRLPARGRPQVCPPRDLRPQFPPLKIARAVPAASHDVRARLPSTRRFRGGGTRRDRAAMSSRAAAQSPQC